MTLAASPASHSHVRSSEHKYDYVKATAEHFDKGSKDQEMIKQGTNLAQFYVPYILKYYEFDKNSTEVLDFAAGWGMAVLALRGFQDLILAVGRSSIKANHTLCQVNPWSRCQPGNGRPVQRDRTEGRVRAYEGSPRKYQGRRR